MHLRRSKFFRAATLVFVLLLMLSGCNTAVASQPSEKTDAFMEAARKALPGCSVVRADGSRKRTVFYEAEKGNAAVCLDMQAVPAIARRMEFIFTPQCLATVVLAVDRDQTRAPIETWADLLRAGVTVRFPDETPIQKAALAALSYGLEGEEYTKEAGLSYLKALRDNGCLPQNEGDAPVRICFDFQTVKMRQAGKNTEIVVPREGTLSFALGVLSKEPVSPASEEIFREAGFRLPNGDADRTLYPEEAAYESAARVADFDRFSEETQDITRDFRRQILHTRLLSSADGREHILAFVYMSILVMLWTTSALYRSFRRDVCRWIMTISGLCCGWMLLGLFKYQLPHGLPARMCWYAYYIPLLLLPLVTLYMAVKIDRPSGKVPVWFSAAAALFPLLAGLVMTNDFHQLVFRFNPGENWNDVYHYGPGYYVVFAYCLLTFLGATLLMIVKSAKSTKRYAVILPLLSVFLLIFYNLGYLLKLPVMRYSNYAQMFCLLVILFSESILRANLIPVNTHYLRLFSVAPFRLQLLDEGGKTVLSAGGEDPLTPEQRQTVSHFPGTVIPKSEDILLHSCKISGGTAVWQENIGALNQLYTEIDLSVQKLQAANALLRRDSGVLREKSAVDAKAQLLAMLEKDLGEKTEMLIQAVREIPEEESGWEARIAYVTLLLCYIKRRSNLFFLSRESDRISGVELTVYLDELSEFACYAGLHTLVRCQDMKTLNIKAATLFYDFYFTTVSWASRESGTTLIGQLSGTEDTLTFSILSSSRMNTLHFQQSFHQAAEALDARIEFRTNDDSDGVYLTCPRKGGGENA